MMKIIIVLPLIIFVLAVFYILYSKSKKVKQYLIKDIDKLKSGKVSNTFILKKTLTDSQIEDIKSYFNSINSQFTQGNNKELIFYINSIKKTFLYGIFDADPLEFPIRIVIFKDGLETLVKMYDTYGFQKFKGKAKDVFTKKNRDAFHYYFEEIEKIVN